MSRTAAMPPGDVGAGPGLVAAGVRRTFGDVVAVDSIDLEVPFGRVTALIGPNGAGKTTLLLILATLLAPDAGTISVAGVDPVRQPRSVRRRIGWMPDVFGTWDTLTCREVLQTVAAAYFMPRSVSRERIEELLEMVHLSDLGDRSTAVLSRGQRQRLGLAQALVHDPDVVLLDEPATGMDPRSRIELRGVVRRLADSGKAVLISSHVLAELDELVDRAVIVDRGRCVGVQEISGPAANAQPRTWRIRSIDPAALLRSLAARGLTVRFTEALQEPGRVGIPRDGIDVELASEEEAARLLAGLVRERVPVTEFAPAGGVLEQVYLNVTTAEGERR